mmetsp:Transcript_53228/g.64175  ORF Transcript_53228/g.64175 Transcript_53228/m.64175 type:complete len:112 (+) Transcript_53228:73-408(+)|eukprot:CAMPEP_0172509926 /NCGR_PEP_ID=MMETSP1066-20121228/224712_1 /TAXON_ID=671091 /ORGANISM="Coscinodiscus wailesii, Strain CCMP2513" /LENGTH=111 /DNA_ID=CAMNT_0013288665 /DNA_START=73 /DNA_END=408 /DNA_ORIENTATION=+
MVSEAIVNKAQALAHRIGPNLFLLIEMVQTHYKGERRISLCDLFAITICLVYIASPVDVIPDPIPVIGLIDDAAVLAIAVGHLRESMDGYKRWKEERGGSDRNFDGGRGGR